MGAPGARAAAKAQGLTRYSTGLPCPNGHLAERMVSNSKCVICLAAISRAKHPQWRERHREEVKEYQRRWYQENRERKLATGRRWYQENRERRLAAIRAYREANPEWLIEYQRRWHSENREHRSVIGRRWYQENREHRLVTIRSYREANPEWYRGSRRNVNHRRRTRTQSPLTTEQRRQIATICQAAVRLSASTGVPYEVHHQVPLAQGGTHTPDNLWILTQEVHRRIHASCA